MNYIGVETIYKHKADIWISSHYSQTLKQKGG